jgi:DNA-binding NtrC family response regulator
MKRILYIDDERSNLTVFSVIFSKYYKVSTAESAEEARKLLETEAFEVILCDQRMPGETGTDFFIETHEKYPTTERILVTAYTHIEDIVEAINKSRIFYYVTKPYDTKDLRLIIDRAIETRGLRVDNERLVSELQSTNKSLVEKNSYLEDANAEIKKLRNRLERENQYLKNEISKLDPSDEIVYRSGAYEKVMSDLRQVAATNSTVLILGQTGTGKELLAKAVHRFSRRSDKSFVKVNCAAIPANLIESELFGHLKGSFTGAINNKVGLFEMADRGTIFLDEVGELPLELQPKLLRVLQEGEFTKLGDSKITKVDVRVVAATNRKLDDAIREGTFRSDLYFRLNVFPIHNPPLSKRKEEIPLLLEHFIKKHSRKLEKEIRSVAPGVLDKLMEYDWPGNIRELENYVERAIILSHDGVLDVAGWDKALFHTDQKEAEEVHTEIVGLDEAEKKYIIKVLTLCKWKITGKDGAAEMLDVKPTTLVSKMKKLGIVNKKTAGQPLE